MSLSRSIGLVLLLALVIGCGEGAPLPRPEGVTVSGKVLLPNGSPVTGGTLVLKPDGGVFGATAEIQADGSFTLQDTGNSDVVPGKYQVFLKFSNPAHDKAKAAVPTKYQGSTDDTDSDVIVDITGSTSDLTITLKS